MDPEEDQPFRQSQLSIDQTAIQQELGAASSLFARLKYLAYAGAATAILVLGLYFYIFQGSLSSDHSRWGQFGDFVGGVLNPTFSFLALIAILATFALQVRELRISTRELKNSADALIKQNDTLRHQNFEATFFQLLRLHNGIINSMDLVRKDGRVTRGRDCLKAFLDRLENGLRESNGNKSYTTFLESYDFFFMEHQDEIGHYFRLLYNIVKLVKRTERIDKRFYTNLIRAQLSSAELMLLFYNCLSTWGRDKFKPLVEEFALLKTMPATTMPDDVLLRKYSVDAFGGKYPESAL